MSKSIFIFKLNSNFFSLQKENNLSIVLETFLNTKHSDFYLEQFKLMMDELDVTKIKFNLVNYFNNKSNFKINNNSLLLYNLFNNNEEIIEFKTNYLLINLTEEKSLFLEYLSLYYFDLIAIEIEMKNIYPLHLVKSKILV